MSITLTIIVCVIIADIITGIVHWWEDTYGDPDFPILGKLVFEPNIKHHEFPNLITKMGGIITHNYQSMLLALFFVLVCYLLGFYTWPILLIAILAGFGNQVHTWNHEPKSSYFVAWLKDSGLIQQQRQHSKHHLPPYDKYYCVLLNFNNAWMERINFWRKLEFIISLFGIKIKRGSEKRNGY